MATFNSSIASNDDDGLEAIGLINWYPNVSGGQACGVGHAGGAEYNSGLRFTGITIPQGATINSATITLNQSTVANTSQGTWYAWDTDNAGQFDDTTNYPSSIPKTTASHPWIDTASASKTLVQHDVTDIVQEIINRGGWSSGNAINFVAMGTDTGGDDLDQFDDYITTSSVPAELDIDYTAGGGGGNPWYYYAQQGAM